MTTQRTHTVSRALEDAATIGALEVNLEMARKENLRLKARLSLALEAAGILDVVFDELDTEDHPAAGRIYDASRLARGQRFVREAA